MWFIKRLFFPENGNKKNKNKRIFFKLKDMRKIDLAPTYLHP